MSDYLVIIESGKNNFAGCNLHIVRGSVYVKAISSFVAKMEIDNLLRSNAILLTHDGHFGDYVMVVDILKKK